MSTVSGSGSSDTPLDELSAFLSNVIYDTCAAFFTAVAVGCFSSQSGAATELEYYGVLHCPGCGGDVPTDVAYSDGGPRPFHWNEQGGGHTMDPAAYTDGEYGRKP